MMFMLTERERDDLVEIINFYFDRQESLLPEAKRRRLQKFKEKLVSYDFNDWPHKLEPNPLYSETSQHMKTVRELFHMD